MTDTIKFDVFLSHNHLDKPKVRWLADQLKSAGLRVWFDEWEVSIGEDIYLAVEQGLQFSKCLALCISENAIASDWVSLERSTALFRDPINKQRRFIPVLISQCELPDSLARYKYVDLSASNPTLIEDLVRAIRGAQTDNPNQKSSYRSPVTCVTDAFRLKGRAIELDFSIWNGGNKRILLTHVGLQEYHAEQTRVYNTSPGRYGLDLRLENDLFGLSYKIDPDDVLPFTAKLAVEPHGGGNIELFGLLFGFSDATGAVRQAPSDCIYIIGAVYGGFAALNPATFDILLDPANPKSPTHKWSAPYPRDLYDKVILAHNKHVQLDNRGASKSSK